MISEIQDEVNINVKVKLSRVRELNSVGEFKKEIAWDIVNQSEIEKEIMKIFANYVKDKTSREAAKSGSFALIRFPLNYYTK